MRKHYKLFAHNEAIELKTIDGPILIEIRKADARSKCQVCVSAPQILGARRLVVMHRQADGTPAVLRAITEIEDANGIDQWPRPAA